MNAQPSLFTQSMDEANAATLVVHCKREPYDVYIGRPGNWGNPFRLESEADRGDAIEKFRAWGERQPWLKDAAAIELKGRALGCWCAPKPCHGHVLQEWANDDPNWVFVFGSNLAGRHGRGAAAHARRWHGAQHGMGIGLQPGGRSWALPTKDRNLKPLPGFDIESHLKELFDEARATPSRHYQLTRVGTGLAGFSDEDMLKAVASQGPIPENVHVPGLWAAQLAPSAPVRVIVAGSRNFEDRAIVWSKLDRVVDRFDGNVEIVSGGAKGPDWFGEEYAVEHNLSFVRFPPLWNAQSKKAAGGIRNQLMAWYSTHLVAFHQDASRGTQSMIDIARRENIAIWVIPC